MTARFCNFNYTKEPGCDNNHGGGGGVMTYVKDSLHYKRRVDLESRNVESIWIELTKIINVYYLECFIVLQILILTTFPILKIL